MQSNGDNSERCANCKGSHKANFNQCPALLKFLSSSSINKKALNRNYSFVQDKTPPNTLNVVQADFDFHNTPGSYFEVENSSTDAVVGPDVYSDDTYANKVRNGAAAKQRETIDTNSIILGAISKSQEVIVKEINSSLDSKIAELKNSLSEEIESKLIANNVKTANFINEILSLKLGTESLKQRDSILKSAIRNHFGQGVCDLLPRILPGERSSPKLASEQKTVEKRKYNTRI